ncbi:hypothetical protein ZOSMA_148G00350 [Zostera marina]|uniref:Uncharacterized protein n=1 Tax=Zostera marina TaxID=29655 RepID=A0A0K9PWT0_ZOSMR|nr:hypothetical protein ZOSMA_148G00350 [Zostera marina]
MGDSDCRPLGFLIGLPFSIVALLLSLVGAVIWVIGTLISCICPCCFCFSALANFAVSLIKLPFTIIKWFTRKFPC